MSLDLHIPLPSYSGPASAHGAESQGAMQVVYVCTLCMFLGLAALGFRSMYADKDLAGVLVALLTFGLFSFLNLLTAVRGAIRTDDRTFENSVCV